MYRHRPPQPGSQPFPGGPRPPRPPHQLRGPVTNIRPPQMNFQFPRPTQLPIELESALTIQGTRDMDHRAVDHRNMPNQHQGAGIGQGYGTNPITSDNRSDQHQGADWSNYQHPNKLFVGSQPNAGRETENRAPVTTDKINWSGMSNESKPRNTGGDGPGLYTSESAGSILASFGLSNEDLEVLSHYPDDQLTPDTLPFILRDIQINKSGPKTKTSNAPSSFSNCNSEAKQCSTLPQPIGHSNEEVPSLLTITQTAGKVIDYGHASRADEENETRTTFKREQLSGERIVKILPPASLPRKMENPENRLVKVDRTERGDKDYRKLSAESRKSSRSPEMDLPPNARNLDHDYRKERPAPRTSSATRSESASKRSSSPTGTKSHNSSKKLPPAAMIGDFSAHTPKEFPYTCSVCHMQCNQEKDWDDHLNTVNHIAACRGLRNKYPHWKPDPPRSEECYTSQSSASRSRSRSPVYNSSESKYHSHYYKPYRRSHSPHESHHRHHYYHHSYSGGSSYRSERRPYDYGNKHYTDFHDDVKHGPPASYNRPCSPDSKVSKPPPAKKKKKLVNPSSEEIPTVNCLLYLTGIPLDATEEEVTDLVGAYGIINNVLLLPCTEEERQRDEGQKASVCMVREMDAQALAESADLFIRDKPITVARAKVPEEESANADGSTPAEKPGCKGDDTNKQKAVVLITELPQGLWSTSDIEQLIQPFGAPSDIIEAKTLGKALVSVPDSDIAEEIEKFHSVMPAKIQNAEIKIVHLKWHRPIISRKTPTALYNLLLGRKNPLFNSQVHTAWNRLLVISNIPASGHSEVEKIVRRFGTVIKTLPLHDMLICEMASIKMATSVNRRFMNFPCILQNNPLSFSRWPDPKITTEALEEKKSTKAKPAKKKTGPVDKALPSDDNEAHSNDTNQEDRMEEMSHGGVSAAPANEGDVGADSVSVSETQEDHMGPPDNSEAPPGGDQPGTPAEVEETEPLAESVTEKNELMESKEELQGEINEETETDEVKEEKQSALKDESPAEDKQDEATGEEAEKGEAKVGEAEEEVAEEEEEEEVAATEEAEEAAEREAQAKEREAQAKEREAQAKEREAQAKEREAQAKEKEAKAKVSEAKAREREAREREAKEREAKEKEAKRLKDARDRREEARERRLREKEREAKERDKRDKERRARDEERLKREKEERDRREKERRERWETERRDRKRSHEDYRRSSRHIRRDEDSSSSSSSKRRNSTRVAEEEEEDFPFDLGEFVTVDEVGEVGDLPVSPPQVSMETSDAELNDSQQDDFQETQKKDTVATLELKEETVAPDPTLQSSSLAPTPQPEPSPAEPATTDKHSAQDGPSPNGTHQDELPQSEPGQGESIQDRSPQIETPRDEPSQSGPSEMELSSTGTPEEKLSQVEPSEMELSLTHTLQDDPSRSDPDEFQTAGAELYPSETPPPQIEIPVVEPPVESSSQLGEAPLTDLTPSDQQRPELPQMEAPLPEFSAGDPAAAPAEVPVAAEEQSSQEYKEMLKAAGQTMATDTNSAQDQSVRLPTKLYTTEEPNSEKESNGEMTAKSLAPYNPSTPVGLEFLVPKTGFFCKPCNRFFTGNREFEITHCKSLKHYQNLQEFLKHVTSS